MKYLALAAALIAPLANADCRLSAVMDQPQVPDGAVASLVQMQEARSAVVEYVTRGEAYLRCISPPNPYFNKVVADLEETASEFNASRNAFLVRRDSIASI